MPYTEGMNRVMGRAEGTKPRAHAHMSRSVVEAHAATKLTISSEKDKTMTETIERTPLTADAIVAAEKVFGPSDGDIHARVLWIIKAQESTNGNATAVAKDVETHYALQGRKAPRGYGRASIVNAGTDATLWERTACGNATAEYVEGDSKPVKISARHLVGQIDAARHAHGAKTVKKLIDATAESLQTEVTASVRLLAMYGALKALVEAPEAEKEETDPPAPTVAQIIALLIKAQEKSDTLGMTDLSDLINDAIDAANAAEAEAPVAE